MEQETKEIIDDLLELLRIKYPDFLGLFLYGSRARGNYTLDSDIDLVFVFNREITWKFKNEVMDVLSDYMIQNNLLLDCKIYNMKDIASPITYFRYNVLKDGLYYGA